MYIDTSPLIDRDRRGGSVFLSILDLIAVIVINVYTDSQSVGVIALR